MSHGGGLLRLWVLLLLALWAGPAGALQLTGVRAFTAPGHARLLLVLAPEAEGGDPDTSALALQTRSSPPIGPIAARGVTMLPGVRLAPELPVEIPVEADGLRRLLVAAVGDGVQVTAELDEARLIRAERIDPRGILVDLQVEEAAAGEGSGAAQAPLASASPLPTREQLVAFVQGVDLVRAAGGRPKDRRVIVVDAGHGGWDHGAVGVTGTREADVALQLALKTAQGLRRDLGAEVILTRDSDVFVGLTQRARIANDAQADLFLSIHANAAPGPAAWGIETYSMDTASDAGAARVAARENAIAWQEGGGEEQDLLAAQLITAGTMRLSRELAAHVQAGVCRDLQTVYGPGSVRDLGTKTALFTVLTRTRMPAILFESSFVSHPQDERKLRAPHFQQAMADALVDAVGAWLARQGAAEGEGR